jgi:hypothetical protein
MRPTQLRAEAFDHARLGEQRRLRLSRKTRELDGETLVENHRPWQNAL